jgi:hypothetical protein
MTRPDLACRPLRLRPALVRGAARASGVLRLSQSGAGRLPSPPALSAWAERAAAALKGAR